jgi:hypothetical protein
MLRNNWILEWIEQKVEQKGRQNESALQKNNSKNCEVSAIKELLDLIEFSYEK